MSDPRIAPPKNSLGLGPQMVDRVRNSIRRED